MKKIDSLIPIYALSVSIVFLAFSISQNGASAATPSSVLTAEIKRLNSQIVDLRDCTNRNLLQIRSYSPERNWTALNRVSLC